MPGANKVGGGQWGITWAEIAEAEEQYAAHHRCRIEWVSAWVRPSPSARRAILTIACFAIAGRPGPSQLVGAGYCQMGGNRGAASAPGAYLRSMIDACGDLERRRADPRYDRDTAVSRPGSE